MKRIIKMIIYYGWIWGMPILIIFGLYIVVDYDFIQPHYLKKNSRYTVSVYTHRDPGYGGHIFYEYKFLVNHKIYYGDAKDPRSNNPQLRNCWVRFHPENPDNNEITDVLVLPKDTVNLPPNGYKFLPHK